jgi:hypothetical protein
VKRKTLIIFFIFTGKKKSDGRWDKADARWHKADGKWHKADGTATCLKCLLLFHTSYSSFYLVDNHILITQNTA